MFEWFDDIREWLDTEGGGWDGDVTVSLPAALTISFSAVNDVAVVGHANIYATTTVMSVDAKAATVSHDYTVICGSVISAAISLKTFALTISSAIPIASAVPLSATVQAATASHATRPAVPLFWLYLTPKQPALTITSDVPISSAIELVATTQEPPHVGVVEMVFVDAALEIAFDFLTVTPILYDVNVEVGCISIAMMANDPSVRHSSSVQLGSAMRIDATCKAASVRLDCIQAVTPLSIAAALKTHTAHGSVNVAVPIGGPIGATLAMKTALVRYNNTVAITQAARVTTAIKAPAYWYDYLAPVDRSDIVATLKSHRPTYGWLHPVDSALLVAADLKDFGVSASTNMRPSALRMAFNNKTPIIVMSSAMTATAASQITATPKEPPFCGPLRPEFILLRSAIVLRVDLVSELDMQMAAYG